MVARPDEARNNIDLNPILTQIVNVSESDCGKASSLTENQATTSQNASISTKTGKKRGRKPLERDENNNIIRKPKIIKIN